MTDPLVRDEVERLRARWRNSGMEVTETTLRVVWQTMMSLGYSRDQITKLRGEVLRAIHE